MEKVEREIVEWRKCVRSPAYFADTYCQIYDSETNDWIPFDLWKEQYRVMVMVHENQLTIVLKARQLGLTWLLLAYALWQMIFQPIATVLIFSKRDDEAIYLAGVERLRGMYYRLPKWMQARAVEMDNDHVWMLSNGSTARAFSTKGGDGYTATLAIIDEADLVPDLKAMIGAVKPTIDAGGKMVLISRVDKSKPNSLFKSIYRAAKQKLNNYAHIFLPWNVRPGRSQQWYEALCEATLAETGSLDDVHEQYPQTDLEALAARTLDKRIPGAWLEQCYQLADPLSKDQLPANLASIQGLVVYRQPMVGRRYVGGADCAEGLPTSDDSATTWIDAITGEEVANLVGKLTPAVHAAYSVMVSAWYNHAALMPENNNHGWTFIQWVKDNSRIAVLEGFNGKPGWTSNSLGKVILYNECAGAFQQKITVIHDLETYHQLGSIEKSTLLAPSGESDDRADSYALAIVGAAAPTENVVYADGGRVSIGWD